MKINKLAIFTVFFLSLISFNSSAQKKGEEIIAPEMPINESTSKISYTNVVETPGDAKSQKEKSYKWVSSYYKNSSSIIKSNTEKEIIAHPRFRILNPKSKKGVQTTAGIVEYFVKIYFKDGKYKYELTDFNWKQTSKFPIEKWMDKESATYKKAYAFYLQQVDEYAKKTIASLEKAMSAKTEAQKDDW